MKDRNIPAHPSSTEKTTVAREIHDESLIDPALLIGHTLALELGKSILRGAKQGVINVSDVILHPMDQFIIPMCKIADAIVTLQAIQDLGINPERQDFRKKLHRAAEKNISPFKQASGMERVELITATLVSTYLSGILTYNAVKMIKPLHAGVKQMTVNYERFGMLKIPDRFENLLPGDLRSLLPIEKSSVREFISALKVRSDAKYKCVITEEGELIISGRWYIGSHADLVEGKPVVFAGEFKISNGRFTAFSNFSGHYQPSGKHLKTIADTVFKRAGMPDAISVYRDVKELMLLSVIQRPYHGISTPLFNFPELSITPLPIGIFRAAKEEDEKSRDVQQRMQESAAALQQFKSTLFSIAQQERGAVSGTCSSVISSSLANIKTLQSSRHGFFSSLAKSSNGVDLPRFGATPRPSISMTHNDVLGWQIALMNGIYMYSAFDREKPPQSHFTFSGGGSGGGGGSGMWCDSSTGICYSYSGSGASDCRDSSSSQCRSSLKF